MPSVYGFPDLGSSSSPNSSSSSLDLFNVRDEANNLFRRGNSLSVVDIKDADDDEEEEEEEEEDWSPLTTEEEEGENEERRLTVDVRRRNVKKPQKRSRANLKRDAMVRWDWMCVAALALVDNAMGSRIAVCERKKQEGRLNK